MASPSPQSSPMPPPQAPSPMGPPQQSPSPSNPQGSPMGPPQHHPHSPTQGYQGGPPPGGPPMPQQPQQQPPPQQQGYPPHPQQMQPNMGPQVRRRGHLNLRCVSSLGWSFSDEVLYKWTWIGSRVDWTRVLFSVQYWFQGFWCFHLQLNCFVWRLKVFHR